MQRLITTGYALLFPGLLLALSLLGLYYLPAMEKSWRLLLLDIAPYLFATTAIVLSQQFNRSRLVFVMLLLLSAAGLQQYADALIPKPLQQIYLSVMMLNILLFSCLKDRGLLSIHGVIRLSFLAVQAGLLYYTYPHYQAAITPWLNIDLLPPLAWLNLYLPLTDSILIVCGVTLLLQFLVTLFHSHRSQGVFFAAQCVLLAIFSSYQTQHWIPLLIISSSLMMVLDVLMNSYDMAYRDELTQLPSRRALNQLLLNLGRRYTIAMMDIDHFKKFNDTHGHDVGDEVLRMVASRIAKVGGGGKAFRYGGEEFTVVFPGKTPDQAEAHLEALRHSIEVYEMVIRQKKRPKDKHSNKAQAAKRGEKNASHKTLSVTISIGFAERNSEQKNPEHVIKAADDALYRAKKAGRNCVQG